MALKGSDAFDPADCTVHKLMSNATSKGCDVSLLCFDRMI